MRPEIKWFLAGAALAPVGTAAIRLYIQLVIALGRVPGTA